MNVINLITSFLILSTYNVNYAKDDYYQKIAHSNVIEDLTNMGINTSSFTENKFITVTKDENYLYLYDYNVDNNVTDVMISYSEKKIDGVYVDESFSKKSIELVSMQNNFYKYILPLDEIDNSNRVVIATLYYMDGSMDDVNMTYLFGSSLSYSEIDLKITLSQAYAHYIKEPLDIFGNTYEETSVLDYIFFNTSLDNVIDRITDVTITYEYLSWSVKESTANAIQYAPYYIVSNMTYDEIKNFDVLYDFNELYYPTQVVSINDSAVLNVEQTTLLGKKVYKYDRLFETKEYKDDDFISQYGSDYRYGVMFHDSKQTYQYGGVGDMRINDLDPTEQYYLLKGEHVTSARLLTISYLSEGKFYENVAVYDEHKELIPVGPDRSGGGLLDFLNELYNEIINFINDLLNMIGVYGQWAKIIFWAIVVIIVLVLFYQLFVPKKYR